MSSVPRAGVGGPSRPETRVYADYNKLTREWTFVEDTTDPGSWIEIDDQHVWQLEDLE